MKDVVVVCGAQGEEGTKRDITLAPGSTAGDVLRQLGLDGYCLSREGESSRFANEEEIYPVVEAGSKLRAVPIATVGVAVLVSFGLSFRYPRRHNHVA